MKRDPIVRHHLVVLGAGYVGGALARRAVAGGWRVSALTRNVETSARLRDVGCSVITDELSDSRWGEDSALVAGAERVAVTVASGGGGAEGYRRSYVEGLRNVVAWGQRLQRCGGTSDLYQQHGGVSPR